MNSYIINNQLDGGSDVRYNGKEMPMPQWTANITTAKLSVANAAPLRPRRARYSSKYDSTGRHGIGLDRATMEPYFRDTTDVRWQERYFIANLAMVYANATASGH